MSNSEKSMCDYVLEKGEIIDHYKEICEGVQIEQYVVLLFGERYVVTKKRWRVGLLLPLERGVIL